MSKRQDIFVNLRARLAEIQVANGYNTDAGLHILMGEVPHETLDDAAASLAVTVRDDEPGSQLEQVVVTLAVQVHGTMKVLDTAAPLDSIEALVADIKTAVEQPDRTLGGTLVARGITRGSTQVFERSAGSEVVAVAVTYNLVFAEAWGNP